MALAWHTAAAILSHGTLLFVEFVAAVSRRANGRRRFFNVQNFLLLIISLIIYINIIIVTM